MPKTDGLEIGIAPKNLNSNVPQDLYSMNMDGKSAADVRLLQGMDSSKIYGSDTDQYDKKIKLDHDATLEEEKKKA